jgi:uncharacterized membrane protein YczE|tara:strand:+ start:225 stop:896 length:672 start_codon:yes stop_codon:yes gene_type:complete
MKIFLIKSVPTVSWSSGRSLNFKPRFLTLALLCFGLVIFGFGEGLLIASGAGVSPWTVFAQGIAIISGWSIGVATFTVGVAVLILWIPMRQTPGIGTILNATIIAAVMEISLPYLPHPQLYVLRAAEAAVGVFLVGLGSAIYLVANLGAGPRDGLMTGLQRITGYPITYVRTSIEVAIVFLGWVLGGTVGLGTLMFAFGIGPALSIGLYLVLCLSPEPVENSL